MKLSQIQRLGGIAIILGSILFAVWAIGWTTLLPVSERSRDISLLILNHNWIWISSMAFPGVILMIFGYTAVYTKLFDNSGISGFIGYIFIIIAYILQAAKITWEIFLYPNNSKLCPFNSPF